MKLRNFAGVLLRHRNKKPAAWGFWYGTFGFGPGSARRTSSVPAKLMALLLCLCAFAPFNAAVALKAIDPGGWRGTTEYTETVEHSGSAQEDSASARESGKKIESDWKLKGRLDVKVQVDDRQPQYGVTAELDAEDSKRWVDYALPPCTDYERVGEDSFCSKLGEQLQEKSKATCSILTRTTVKGRYQGSIQRQSSIDADGNGDDGQRLFKYKVGFGVFTIPSTKTTITEVSIVKKSPDPAVSCKRFEKQTVVSPDTPQLISIQPAEGLFPRTEKQVRGQVSFSPKGGVTLDLAPPIPAKQVPDYKRLVQATWMSGFGWLQEFGLELQNLDKATATIARNLTRDESAPPLPELGKLDEKQTKAAADKWNAAAEKMKAAGIAMPTDESKATPAQETGSPAAAGSKMAPGLWQYAMKMEMPGMPFPLPPIVTKQCLTQADVENGNIARDSKKQSECEVKNYKHGGGVLSYDVTCPKTDPPSTGHYEFTVSATTMQGAGTIETEGRTMKNTFDGKRLGDCK